MIMYLGRIVEKGPVERVFEHPAHPYTRALLDAIPEPDPRLRKEVVPLEGETPSPVSPPAGCAFHPRCPFAIEACKAAVPPLEPAGPPLLDGPPGAPMATESGHVAGDAARAEHVSACIRKHEIREALAAKPTPV